MTATLYAFVRHGLVALVMIVGLALALRMSALGPGSSPSFAAPEGVVFVAATPGPGVISSERAINFALEHYQALNAEARVEAYLGTTTDSTMGLAVNERLVWVVHLSGIAMPVSIPAGVRLASPPGDQSNGYIYIDAYSGKWLISRFEN
jgi:hypothetical protein